jgi:hypothetical protein
MKNPRYEHTQYIIVYQPPTTLKFCPSNLIDCQEDVFVQKNNFSRLAQDTHPTLLGEHLIRNSIPKEKTGHEKRMAQVAGESAHRPKIRGII